MASLSSISAITARIVAKRRFAWTGLSVLASGVLDKDAIMLYSSVLEYGSPLMKQRAGMHKFFHKAS